MKRQTLKSSSKKLLLLLISIFLILPAESLATKKKKEEPKLVEIQIPNQTIEALKKSNIPAAVRNLRLYANSPRTKHLLVEMRRIKNYDESDNQKSINKNHNNLYDLGVGYHNLYLFLKGYNIDNEKFVKEGLKYYKKTLKTKNPSLKNKTYLTMASLYASSGNTKNAEKYFSKTNIDLIPNKFTRYELLAFYFASMNDVPQAIEYLKLAYDEDYKDMKFWLGISDDFTSISEDEKFKALMKRWEVERLNKGVPRYLPQKKK